MFGSFRLILAIMVAIAHLWNSAPDFLGLMWGVPAAVAFYVLSGYTMTGLLRVGYQRFRFTPHFYLDRLMRVGPQYYALLVLALVWWLYSGQPQKFFLQNTHPGVIDYINNILIIPLNYFMYNGSWKFSLVPTAWMLGAELQFYLIFPFLFFFRLRIPALLLALAVMMLAHWGTLDGFTTTPIITGADTFGYRIMPGVLVYFLLGSFLYEIRNLPATRKWQIMVAISAAVGIWCLCLLFHGTLDQDYIRGSMLGMTAGMFLITWLGGHSRRHWDEILGHLSYGVYLNHFLVQWALLSLLLPSTWPTSGFEGLVRMTAYIAISIALAWAGWRWVDDPIMRWRRHMRARLKTNSVGKSARSGSTRPA